MAKKLKIAVVVNEFPSVSITFILNQVIGLLEKGHDVDIVSSRKSLVRGCAHEKLQKYNLLDRTIYQREMPFERFERLVLFVQILSKYIWNNLNVIYRCLNLKKYGFFESLNRLFLSEPFLRKKYDVVHCQFGPLGKKYIFLKDIMDVKFVTSFRGYDITHILKENSTDYYNELFDKGDLVLPVCKYFKDKLIELGCLEQKIEVLYSGLYIEDFIPVNRKPSVNGALQIVSIGRLVEKKGIKNGILAISKLKEKNVSVSYTIIGEGILESELKNAVKELNLEDIVKFTGALSDNEVYQHLLSADVFMLPCVTAQDGDQEGIPNVLKEAMLMEIPVLSTQHSGIPELIEHPKSGLLVEENDIEALVDQLVYVNTHSKECRGIGLEGRKVVESKFNIGELTNRLEKLYYSA